MPTILITEEEVRNGAMDSLRDLEQLSQVRLRWAPSGGRTFTTDIGLACFAERGGSSWSISVVPSSIVLHPLLPDIIRGAVRAAVDSRWEVVTTTLKTVVTALVADEDFEITTYQALFSAVSAILRTRCDLGELTSTSAANAQSASLLILEQASEQTRDSIAQGVRLFRRRKKPRSEKSVIPTEAALVLATVFSDHFLQVARALISETSFPIKISVADEHFLITGVQRRMSWHARYLALSEEGTPAPDSLYDESLQLRFELPSEVTAALVSGSRQKAGFRRAAEGEARRLEVANSNPASFNRLIAISDALVSFIACTYFDTGANGSQLQGNSISDGRRNGIHVTDLLDDKGSVKLHQIKGSSCFLYETVKPRAGNKKISILFSSTWIRKILPTYLELREHIESLGFELPTALLFTMSVDMHGRVSFNDNPSLARRLWAAKQHVAHHFLSRFGLDSLSVSQIRHFKSSTITRLSGVRSSAALLGHTQKTALEQYNLVSETDAQLQLAGVLNSLSSIAVSAEIHSEHEQLPMGGHCSKPDDADEVIVESTELGLHSPSCRTKSGCWMCPHFAVHADTTDYWKIRSYLFVLGELRMSSEDFRLFADVHKPIEDRLAGLLDRISDSRPDLRSEFIRIDSRVRNGGLHSAYAELVETYEQLGVI